MTPRIAHRPLLFLVLLGTFFWCVGLVWLHQAGRAQPLDRFENALLDVRFALAGPRPSSSDIAIVVIDDETLADPATRGLSRRDRLAVLIRHIAQSGARTLALDVLLADQGAPETDAALAAALGEIPSVIAAAASFPDRDGAATLRLIWPQEVFAQKAQAGLVNVSTDTNGVPRYVPLVLESKGELLPSLPLLSALTYSSQAATFEGGAIMLGNKRIPLDAGLNMPLRHLGPKGSVKTVSAQAFLSGPNQDIAAGKLVLLGYTATAMGDRFQTPYSEDTPGVEIIATAISQLLTGPVLRRDDLIRQWDMVHAFVLAVTTVLALLCLPLSRGLPLAVILVVTSFAAAVAAFSAGIWISAALPLAAAAVPMLFAGAWRYALERSSALESDRSAASLRRFQSPALAQFLESDPDYLARPQEQELAVFFVDLTGFTSLSQQLGTEGTRRLLAWFHALTARAVEAEGGSVFNYMGDGAMAIFGLQDGSDDKAADHALAASFALVAAMRANCPSDLAQSDVTCRIGLHKGPATLSRLGAKNFQQLTASGDTVNLASRLMEVSKEQGAVICASRAFCNALTTVAGVPDARVLNVPIRGRKGVIEVLCWARSEAETRGAQAGVETH